jgi:hypothetical protein
MNNFPIDGDLYKVALEDFFAALSGSRHVVQAWQEASRLAETAQRDCDVALRETLAQTRSVRYKDFDRVMSVAFGAQKKREAELGASVNAYLDEQEELSRTILDELAALRSTMAEQRTKEVHAMMKKFSELQRKRRDELLAALREFKTEQQDFLHKLRDCTVRAREVRLQDVKAMFESFRQAQEERRAQAELRRKEVAKLLAGFRQKRLNEHSTNNGAKPSIHNKP